MALYYTLDEFIETLQKELQHLNTYARMLGYIRAQEAFHLKAGVRNSSEVEASLENLLVDADTNLEEVEAKLTVGSNPEVDFTKYAFEVRVGSPGLHHHTTFNIVGTPGTNFSTKTADAEGLSINAYYDGVGAPLFATGDIVEIINSGNTFMDGFFTLSGAATVSENIYAEAGLVNAADSIDQAYNAIVRLRER